MSQKKLHTSTGRRILFVKNEPPTIQKNFQALQKSEDLPHLKQTSLMMLLKELKYQ